MVDVRTTYDDWDLWEQEVLSDASRRPLALKAGIGFIAVAVLLAIVAPVALVFRAGDEPTAPVSPLSTTRASGVPTSVAGSSPRTVPPLPTRFVATTAEGRLLVSTAGAWVSAGIGMHAPRVALMPGGQSAVVERSDA